MQGKTVAKQSANTVDSAKREILEGKGGWR